MQHLQYNITNYTTNENKYIDQLQPKKHKQLPSFQKSWINAGIYTVLLTYKVWTTVCVLKWCLPFTW